MTAIPNSLPPPNIPSVDGAAADPGEPQGKSCGFQSLLARFGTPAMTDPADGGQVHGEIDSDDASAGMNPGSGMGRTGHRAQKKIPPLEAFQAEASATAPPGAVFPANIPLVQVDNMLAVEGASILNDPPATPAEPKPAVVPIPGLNASHRDHANRPESASPLRPSNGATKSDAPETPPAVPKVLAAPPADWRHNAPSEAPTPATPSRSQAQLAPVIIVRATVVAAAIPAPIDRLLGAPRVTPATPKERDHAPRQGTDADTDGDLVANLENGRTPAAPRTRALARLPVQSAVAERAAEGSAAGQAPPSASSATVGLSQPTLGAVAAAIVNTANRPEVAGPFVATGAPVPVAADASAHVMMLHLDLPGHGGVDVRIQITGHALRLTLSADRDDTVRRLRHDHDALVRALGDGGYDATIRTVHNRPADASQAPSDPNGARHGAGSDASRSGDDGHPASSQRPVGDDNNPRRTAVQEIVHDKTRPDAGSARDLYV